MLNTQDLRDTTPPSRKLKIMSFALPIRTEIERVREKVMRLQERKRERERERKRERNCVIENETSRK